MATSIANPIQPPQSNSVVTPSHPQTHPDKKNIDETASFKNVFQAFELSTHDAGLNLLELPKSAENTRGETQRHSKSHAGENNSDICWKGEFNTKSKPKLLYNTLSHKQLQKHTREEEHPPYTYKKEKKEHIKNNGADPSHEGHQQTSVLKNSTNIKNKPKDAAVLQSTVDSEDMNQGDSRFLLAPLITLPVPLLQIVPERGKSQNTYESSTNQEMKGNKQQNASNTDITMRESSTKTTNSFLPVTLPFVPSTQDSAHTTTKESLDNAFKSDVSPKVIPDGILLPSPHVPSHIPKESLVPLPHEQAQTLFAQQAILHSLHKARGYIIPGLEEGKPLTINNIGENTSYSMNRMPNMEAISHVAASVPSKMSQTEGESANSYAQLSIRPSTTSSLQHTPPITTEESSLPSGTTSQTQKLSPLNVSMEGNSPSAFAHRTQAAQWETTRETLHNNNLQETCLQIAKDFREALQLKKSSFDIHLKPEGMGHVHIHVHFDKNTVEASFQVDQNALPAFLQNREQIASIFESHGFQADQNSLSFNLNQGGQQHNQQQESPFQHSGAAISQDHKEQGHREFTTFSKSLLENTRLQTTFTNVHGTFAIDA